MAQDRRGVRALAALLPAGTLGFSMSLASVDAKAALSSGSAPNSPKEVAKRLQSIREAVSDAAAQAVKEGGSFVTVDPELQLAWWHNGGWGWHNHGWGLPGWGNGGWHNGGWGNGWHNGGWGNGWHNGGWGNGWHNW
jgi:rSAM-associated Gly-rich repeat protein